MMYRFQLLRAKQCPYFYVIANTFIVLFRAAGVNGYTEMNACMSPTTRGFRQLLKDEGTISARISDKESSERC